MVPRVVLFLLVAVLGCSRGPSNRDLYEANKVFGERLLQQLGRVRDVITAAPAPAVGAPCTQANLTLSTGSSYDRGTTPVATGNTEVIGLGSLVEPGISAANGEYVQRLKVQDPLQYVLMLGPRAPLEMAQLSFAPGGWLADGGGSRTSDRASTELRDDLERAKRIQWIVVTRSEPGERTSGERATARISSFLVRLADARITCGFGVEAASDAGVEDTWFVYTNGGGLAGTNDAVRASSRSNAIHKLRGEMSTRFGLTLPRYSQDDHGPNGLPGHQASAAR